jgi:excisionase family DNA binding protein
MSTRVEGPKLLTPAEVAALFRVDPKTVTRWAKAGRLTTLRTVGGHRRYLQTEIEQMLQPQVDPYGPISRGGPQ